MARNHGFLAMLAALALFACGSEDEKSEPKPPLSVMTYNLLCSICNLTDYDPWEERLAYFEDIFARHDPDLIGVQELTFLTGEVDALLARAPGRAAVYYKPETGLSYPDATILYRTSRFTLLEHGEYWLSPTPDVPNSTGFADAQVPRLVVWARFRDEPRKRELYFASTHFDNNSPSQELSAPLVLERTAPEIERGPVIVVGDFNSTPSSTAYQILTDQLANTYDLAAERTLIENSDPPPSYDMDERIDHVFVAGQGISWAVSRWTADLSVYGPLSRPPSDHFPIAAIVDHD